MFWYHWRLNTGADDKAWPVTVHLSNGKSFGADLVISAIGVRPNVEWLPAAVLRDKEDGGILVDRSAIVPSPFTINKAVCSVEAGQRHR